MLNVNRTSMLEKWNNRTLFLLFWPLLVEQLLAVTMGAADTVMVSSLGEHAVSGVNIIDNINNLLIIAFIALSTGGAVVVSQYIGRQDNKNASLASKQLVYSVFFISLVLTGIALAFRAPLIRLLYGSLADDVMDAAMLYFLVTALSYPMLAVYNSCAALFRSAGNSQVPMRIALLVNILNVGGNAFFIYVLKIGVLGAALSTLISRTVAAVILVVLLLSTRRYSISLSGIHKMKLVPQMIRKILNVGIPTGLEQSMFQIGRLLTQRIFPYFGTAIIAGNAVTSVINSFSFMTGTAFGMGLLTVVGQCIGAGDYAAAKKFTSKIMKITWLALFVVSGLSFLFRRPLIGMFNLIPEATDAAIMFLAVHSVAMGLAWTFSFAMPNALRAAGDARYVMIVAAISMWTVRVIAAYLLTFKFTFVFLPNITFGLGLGPVGVWLSMGGDFLFRSICYVNRWMSGRWQNKKVIDS